MAKILRNSRSAIQLTLYDQNGAAVNADTNPATIAGAAKVTDSAGVEVAGSPFTITRITDPGVYSFSVGTAITALLDLYAVEWTFTLDAVAQKRYSDFEVVGAHYFEVPDARAFDGGRLGSTTTYPAASIIAGRERAEDALEAACSVAFVPRARRVTLDGDGTRELILPDRYPRRVVSGSIDGVALTAADIADLAYERSGRLVRKTLGGWGGTHPDDVVLLYEHGMDRPPPRARRAALLLLADDLIASNVGARVLSHTDESGTRQYAVAGRGRAFGIPEVDALVREYAPSIGVW